MIESFVSRNLIKQLSIDKYDKFCSRLKDEYNEMLDLGVFKDASICSHITQLCGDIFEDEISNTILLLNNTEIGISAIDIPETSLFDKSSNAIYGAAAVIGIFNNIGHSSIDPVNTTPFTLHTASHSSVGLLESIDYTPDVKLGFHNDGLVSSNSLEIPKNIVVYNLYIGYKRPGKFKWIPTALWDDADKYGEIAMHKNINVNVKLTPYYYLNKNGDISKAEFEYIRTPISYTNEYGQRRFFINGKVLYDDNPKDYVNFVKSIRDSLDKNTRKISIDQKERRAFYLKNTMGFHARDVFEDPIKDLDLSRVFLRSVDINTEIYPSTTNKY